MRFSFILKFKSNFGYKFKKQSYRRVFKFNAYKRYNSDLWGILYNSGKRCRVVRHLYYLFASFPMMFPRNSAFMAPSFSVIRLKSRKVLIEAGRRPDFFQLLCNLKFKSFGGLLKPGQGSRYKRRRFNFNRIKIFYGNYTWSFWFKYIYKTTLGGGDGRHEFQLFDIFESRISTILFRSTLFLSLYEAMSIVRLGFVMVNKIVLWCPFVLIRNWDFITFIPQVQLKLRKFLKFRLKFFRFFAGPPLYLEVDYVFCHIIYIRFFFKASNIRATFLTKASILQGCYSNFK